MSNGAAMGSGVTLGIDFGTSGARAIALGPQDQILAQSRVPWTAEPGLTQWQRALGTLLREIPTPIRHQIQAIACNGTSGTILLSDGAGEILTEPLAYNDDRGATLLPQLEAAIPAARHTLALTATAPLVKLRWWRQQLPLEIWQQARHLLHQADWLAYQFHGRLGLSDYHNALKLGYDPAALAYAPWWADQPEASLLPQVVAPGHDWGAITPGAAARFDLSPHCRIVAGTTDSIAAFLASGATQPGQAVTSLGSTLVVKLLSRVRVEDGATGVYSHRLGNLWLVGGASNTGGAVLRHFFSDRALIDLSTQIDPTQPSPLDYYPLLHPGERFPHCDPHYPPRLSPRPADEAAFLHGLLEGMARIEAQGYRTLEAQGVTPVQRVWTAGGGAQNRVWQEIRQRVLGVPVEVATPGEAAVGSARLARVSRVT